MQGYVGGFGKLAVALYHQRHAGSLHGDLHQVEAHFLEISQLVHSGFHHGFGHHFFAVFAIEIGVERAAVHADADRHASVACFGSHLLDVFGAADVARVETQAGHACIQSGQGHFVLVMDVGH